MLNKLTIKEQSVQYALGLVSWYHINTTWYQGNFKDVSGKGALQQFREHIAFTCYPSESKLVLQDIDSGRYKIKILSWNVTGVLL